MGGSVDESRTIENLELVKRLVASFAAGDLEACFALMDPQAEFANRTGAPGLEGTYVGREQMLGMLAKINEVFENYRVEPLRFEGGQRQVAVLQREVARGRSSGVEINQQTVLLHTLADGKVTRIEAFPYHHGDLREVLGRA